MKPSISFASRISFWIIGTAAVVLLLLCMLLQHYVSNSIIHEETQRAWGMMRTTEQRVSTVLEAVETAVRNNVPEIEDNLSSPEDMYRITSNIVKYNPMVMGSAIAFAPNYYPEKGEMFSPYSYSDGDSIYSIQLGTPDYQYHSKDWYLTPSQRKKGYWCDPYYDRGGGERMMITYSYPLLDAKGEVYAVVTADVALDWLSALVDSLKHFDHSYTFVLGRSGTFITYPTDRIVLHQDFLSVEGTSEDPVIDSIGRDMLRGKTGSIQFDDYQFGSSYIFYSPVKRTGWSVAIVCDSEDIFAPAKRVGLKVVLYMIMGLLLLAFVSYRAVRYISRPLELFASSADEIARGNLQAPLPTIRTHDEMQQLYHSFALMQSSLAQQMEELKAVNEQKGRIEGELKVASSIQKSMLPKTFPPYPERDDIDVFGLLTPAKAVGGDLYDFYIRDEKLFFCIGDVSGKGVPASLVMAVTRSLFRTVSAHESAPHRILFLMNEAMADQNESNMFVTLFIGVLDLPTGRFRYSNAGHDAPFILGDGVALLPTDANIPAGIMSGWKFTSQEVNVTPGTVIFLYTDGLTEAEDVDHAQFGESRIEAVAKEALSVGRLQGPESLIVQMTDAVKAFVGDAEQSDDLTMLAIQYTKPMLDVRLQSSITLHNDVQEVPKLAAFIDEICEKLNFDPATSMQMNLAMEEAVVNVMNYAYPAGVRGLVNIEAQANDVRLKFIISDNGTPFDPTSREETDTSLSTEQRPIGGLGIHLMRQLMDSINYERTEDCNILTLRKKLTGLTI